MTIGRKLVDRMKAVNEALEQDDLSKLFPRYVTLVLRPTPYNADDVKAVRKLLGITQRVFAIMLGVSVKTVRAWEQGAKTPSSMACRFMDKVKDDPKAALGWLRRLAVSHGQ